MRTKAKRTLKKQSPSDKPALKPDDLPQVEGFCCGHAYLKLSDSQGCACLCQQCIGKSSMKQNKGVVLKGALESREWKGGRSNYRFT